MNFGGSWSPREIKRPTEYLPIPRRHGEIVRDDPYLSQTHGPASKYFQRGWTYQEYYLSQSRLIFGKKQIHWSCSCAVWHEDEPELEQRKTELEYYFKIPNILSGKPDFRELSALMFEYHTRDFTCPDDALPGVTGLLTLLSRTFKGGFICGHPEAWFDATLMWNRYFRLQSSQVYPGTTSLERRRVGEQPLIPPEAVLPSWSWIGWKSHQLHFLLDEEDFELPGALADESKCITTPITTWYSHETPTSDRLRIQSFQQKSHKLPGSFETHFEGWVVEEYDPSRHQFDGNDKSKVIGKRVYSHPGLPNR